MFEIIKIRLTHNKYDLNACTFDAVSKKMKNWSSRNDADKDRSIKTLLQTTRKDFNVIVTEKSDDSLSKSETTTNDSRSDKSPEKSSNPAWSSVASSVHRAKEDVL